MHQDAEREPAFAWLRRGKRDDRCPFTQWVFRVRSFQPSNG